MSFSAHPERPGPVLRAERHSRGEETNKGGQTEEARHGEGVGGGTARGVRGARGPARRPLVSVVVGRGPGEAVSCNVGCSTFPPLGSLADGAWVLVRGELSQMPPARVLMVRRRRMTSSSGLLRAGSRHSASAKAAKQRAGGVPARFPAELLRPQRSSGSVDCRGQQKSALVLTASLHKPWPPPRQSRTSRRPTRP